MKIAVFYPRSITCAWSVSEAMMHAMHRAGHEPLDCGLDPALKSPDPRRYPPREVLATCDAILISGPEHIGKFLQVLYPDWRHVRVLKVAYLHESVRREDYGTLDLDRIKVTADVVFCPAVQDETFGLRYLPFPVDTATFNPGPAGGKGRRRPYAAVFIGTLYGKRQEYYEQMGLRGLVRVGKVQVVDLDGINIRASARLLAESYRAVRVLVNLPSLSRLLVTKIGEALACGTFVLTPAHFRRGGRQHAGVRRRQGSGVLRPGKGRPAEDHRILPSPRRASPIHRPSWLPGRPRKAPSGPAALRNAGCRGRGPAPFPTGPAEHITIGRNRCTAVDHGIVLRVYPDYGTLEFQNAKIWINPTAS